MSQQHQMGAMGGPVGGPVAPPNNAGTPTNSSGLTQDSIIKKLNTAIYDYLLCEGKYDVARAFQKEMQIETEIKQSPNQRQGQPNGIDNSMDLDSKEHAGIRERPKDLPAPHSLSSEDSPFLQDWWCQFWELYQGNRQKGKPTTLSYVGTQRQAFKQRAGMVVGADPNSMRPGFNNMVQNGMGGGDLRQAAMKNGMSQQQQQQAMAMQMKARQAGQGGQMQGGSQMERSGSQMNMSDPRSGSPNTGGDAPSPKRQRLDGAGNMQQMNQARAGQAQMQGSNQSVEVYSQAMQQQMQSAMQRANSSNANKGMPQNPAMGPGGPGGAQTSPMNQQNFDANAGELYSTPRMGGMPPQNGAAAPGQQGGNNGNHALQDYQMQLMLLEQQNKKRLLMARQEQDSIAHPPGVQGPNNGAGRGSPQPGMMDPNPAMRQPQMVMGPNGQPMMRPPSSHPMGQQMTQQQVDMMRQQQMMQQNGGNWPQGGPQPQPGQMMPGQQPGQQGPPGQGPNMTPRSGNMPPPPAPANAQGGTQPSSPAQQPAPPTPSQTNKAKPGTKKAAEKKGAAAKKDAAENAPTPTPPPPVTPNNAASFNQNKIVQMPNGQSNAGQPQQNGQLPNAVQPQQPDMNVAPFGALDGPDHFSGMDFANLDSGDVLDNFDFDSFLNNTGGDEGLGFDASFAFGDGGIETDIGGN